MPHGGHRSEVEGGGGTPLTASAPTTVTTTTAAAATPAAPATSPHLIPHQPNFADFSQFQAFATSDQPSSLPEVDKHSEAAAAAVVVVAAAAAGQVGVLHTVRRVGDTVGARGNRLSVWRYHSGFVLFWLVLNFYPFAFRHENDGSP